MDDKACPKCGEECPADDDECVECGYDFTGESEEVDLPLCPLCRDPFEPEDIDDEDEACPNCTATSDEE